MVDTIPQGEHKWHDPRLEYLHEHEQAERRADESAEHVLEISCRCLTELDVITKLERDNSKYFGIPTTVMSEALAEARKNLEVAVKGATPYALRLISNRLRRDLSSSEKVTIEEQIANKTYSKERVMEQIRGTDKSRREF